jgi:hypothetical protein
MDVERALQAIAHRGGLLQRQKHPHGQQKYGQFKLHRARSRGVIISFNALDLSEADVPRTNTASRKRPVDLTLSES